MIHSEERIMVWGGYNHFFFPPSKAVFPINEIENTFQKIYFSSLGFF